MNYLAHFHLGAGNEGLVIGGLLGDFVKGPLNGHYPKDWELGIKLHRQIDSFTDNHPVLKDCQQMLAPSYRRYSGIMLDVLFDHFLNQHWQRFHPQTLTAFSTEIYEILTHAENMPKAARQQADVLIRHDVLGNYRHWQTVEATLQKISKRLRRENPLMSAAAALKPHYDELERFFLLFYPSVQNYAEDFRKANLN